MLYMNTLVADMISISAPEKKLKLEPGSFHGDKISRLRCNHKVDSIPNN